MELTYEEKLQLDNGKEHLQVVLSNIRIASGELTKIYDLLAEAKTDISKANEDRERILRENSEALLGISLRQSAQDRREESLSTRENNINEKEKDVEYRINIANSKLENILKDISVAKLQYDDSVTIHQSVITDLISKRDSILEEIKVNKERNEKELGVKKELENEIFGLNNQIEEAKKEFQKFQITAKAELASIILEQEQEREKIKNPLELIRIESELLDIKISDLAVIKARLTKQYAELNPDKVLPIELQQKDGE